MGLRILWIDDEIAATMKFLVMDLKLAGYRVDPAIYISECCTLLESYTKSETKPDIIILDIMIPIRKEDEACYRSLVRTYEEISTDNSMRAGLDLVDSLKQNLPGTPIIVYTNLNENTEIGQRVFDELRRRYPAIEILQKPQFAEVLVAAMERAITQGKGGQNGDPE
jgi:CheY-like chemotaxis protein